MTKKLDNYKAPQKEQILKREDWLLFANVNTLTQKAGVSKDQLVKLVAKELTDNALDAGANARTEAFMGTRETGSCLQVTDDGEGIPGNDSELVELFSINRPLMSSKIIRKPGRGALGNGLRVVAGTMFALGGRLELSTRGRALEIKPGENGRAVGRRIGAYQGEGTIVKLWLPYGYVIDSCLKWAERAILANRGTEYTGRTSLWWYDSDSFYALLKMAPEGISIRKFLADYFDGCTGRKAGQITADFYNVDARSLTRNQAEGILEKGRNIVKPVSPGRLPLVGELPEQLVYKKTCSEIVLQPGLGTVPAKIPVVIEVWGMGGTTDFAMVNKTPVTDDFSVKFYKKEWSISGCNIVRYVDKKCKIKPSIGVNISCPYMPITTDGKAPDFSPIKSDLTTLIEKVVNSINRGYSEANTKKKRTEKEIVTQYLQRAIDKASNNGQLRYQERQLYYAVRPYVMEELGKELSAGNFKTIISDIENELGEDLPRIIRKNRGVFVHPFDGMRMPLGTINVEKYKRPEYQFNKVLYIEKEGFFDLMLDAEIPQRFDLAMMTSEGFSSRAARDLIDLIGETDEPVQFFCIHDADAAGTKIYDTLVYATRIREARSVEVIDLGLHPGEALEMGLQVEKFSRKRKSAVSEDYKEWEHWLQYNRVELNAMDSKTFIDWIESKLKQYHIEKLVPPIDHLGKHAELEVQRKLNEAIETEVREEYNIEEIVQERFQARLPLKLELLDIEELRTNVIEKLELKPAHHWKVPVESAISEIVSEEHE